MKTFNLYDRVKVKTTGGEGMVLAIYTNNEYRTDVDGVQSGDNLEYIGKHKFGQDIDYPFSMLVTKGEDWVTANKAKILKLIGNGITTGCVPNRANLEKLLVMLLATLDVEVAYVCDLKRIGLMIIDGQYKHEFRYTYHKQFAHNVCSTTSEYFSMIRQILNYNRED